MVFIIIFALCRKKGNFSIDSDHWGIKYKKSAIYGSRTFWLKRLKPTLFFKIFFDWMDPQRNYNRATTHLTLHYFSLFNPLLCREVLDDGVRVIRLVQNLFPMPNCSCQEFRLQREKNGGKLKELLSVTLLHDFWHLFLTL